MFQASLVIGVFCNDLHKTTVITRENYFWNFFPHFSWDIFFLHKYLDGLFFEFIFFINLMDGQIGLVILFSSLHTPNSSDCNCSGRISILSEHTIKKNIIIIIIIPEILRSILQRTSSSRIKLLISLPG